MKPYFLMLLIGTIAAFSDLFERGNATRGTAQKAGAKISFDPSDPSALITFADASTNVFPARNVDHADREPLDINRRTVLGESPDRPQHQA